MISWRRSIAPRKIARHFRRYCQQRVVWRVGCRFLPWMRLPSRGIHTFLTTNYTATVLGGQPIRLTPEILVLPRTRTWTHRRIPEISRFCHVSNTEANALMMDGHVQTFTYNKTTRTSDMLRSNVCVSAHRDIVPANARG